MMILDSNIIIYAALPEHKLLRDLIKKEAPQISAITKVEVLGFHKLTSQAKGYFETFFEAAFAIPITSSIINRAVHLRQQKKMSLGDALIAATALEHQLTLLTRNISDFEHIQDLTVIDPFDNQGL